METQRVVVIQDASREVCLIAIKWIRHGLSLKPGDMLTLISILHQVNNPSTLSFVRAGKMLGYRSRVDSSIFGPNRKIVDDEVARIKEEYQNNEELTQISKIYETQKIKFNIEVDAGPSPKVVALEAAKKLRATWVILDRQMKKDKRYFLEKLSCGISRMKRDNNIEELRRPKAIETNRFSKERSRSNQVPYEEMLPGSLEAEDLFSIELCPTTSISSLGSTESASSTDGICSLHHDLKENRTKTMKETVRVADLYPSANIKEMSPIEAHGMSKDPNQMPGRSREDLMGSFPLQFEDELDNSLCTICKSRPPKIGWATEFSYADLQAATNGFSQENLIWKGENGAVFRGQLESTLTVAVKQQKDLSFQEEKKFRKEVQTLGKARHKNVVMLLGSCSEESHRLLVYEYVCNGSLDQHLAKQRSRPLTWEQRIKIAQGTSKGLNHLHENNIIHRDLQPRNIFLTHDHEPLLGGFGSSTTQNHPEESLDNRIIGTFGYLAPEYTENGKASTKTDVYSLGVVLLELISGRSTTDMRLEEKSLLGWARPLLKERQYHDVIDPKIAKSHDDQPLIWMVQVAEKCLSKDPQKRLSMDKVVSILEHITEGKTPVGIDLSVREISDTEGSIPSQMDCKVLTRKLKTENISTASSPDIRRSNTFTSANVFYLGKRVT
ncbi:unnamed protein product [Ilex paraguariensis]|uniref:Protein kinase domain-containing protein n=1 Tax=Ilex paraguariensis TaxID=185542 RepID=A0ABC8UT41_9AQUA